MRTAFATLVFLLLAATLVGQVPEPSTENGVAERVNAAIADWRKERDEGACLRRLLAEGAAALPRVGELLQESERLPLRVIAEALGEIGDERALELLGGMLVSKQTARRRAAIRGHERRGKVSRDILLDAVCDTDPGVRREAREAVVRLAAKHPMLGVPLAIARRLNKARELITYARILGALASEDAVSMLRDWLDDSEDRMKMAALKGLVLIGDPNDGEAVLDLLWSDSIGVKKEACLFLGTVRHRAAVHDLVELLAETRVRGNAHWALRRITGLRLKPDAELWMTWWERSGAREYGDQSGTDSD